MLYYTEILLSGEKNNSVCKFKKCLKICTIWFKRINLCTVAEEDFELYEFLYGAALFTPAVPPFAHAHCFTSFRNFGAP